MRVGSGPRSCSLGDSSGGGRRVRPSALPSPPRSPAQPSPAQVPRSPPTPRSACWTSLCRPLARLSEQFADRLPPTRFQEVRFCTEAPKGGLVTLGSRGLPIGDAK